MQDQSATSASIKAFVACLSATFFLTGTAYATPLYVATSGANVGTCQASATPCLTITYALSQAAASGDTINIGAGTFTEELDVAKSVVLAGSGNSATIIKAPATLTARTGQIPSGNSVTSDNNAIVWVHGAITVTIQNLKVTGPGSSGCASIGFGLFAGGGATLTVSNNRVDLIQDAPFSSCQNGTAIRYGAQSTSQVASGAITNNTIVNYQKNGVTVDNTGSIVSITGNTIIGTQPPPVIAQNGIQVSRGAQATIINNSVSSNQCSSTNAACGPGFDKAWSTGLLLFNAGATTISNNTFSGNDAGIVGSNTSSSGPFMIAANTFTNNRVGVFAEAGTLNLTGNTISGGNYGVLAAAYADSATNSLINLNGGNIVSGAAIAGVSVYDELLTDALTASVIGSGNQFVGNAVGASNTTPPQGTVNLTCNWWGSAYGPSNSANPLGTGNPATANTAFTNWATNNTSFTCNGNAANNQLLAQPAAVPTLNFAMLMLLAGLLASVTRRRRDAR